MNAVNNTPILPSQHQVNAKSMTAEEMQLKIKQLEAQLASQKNSAPSLSLKVSAKGAVSMYGLGRFPVTLYSAQWAKLIAVIPQLEKFIHDNQDKLAVKGETKPETEAKAA